MRTFSSTVQNLINQDKVDFFVLIKLSFPTQTYYLSSLPYNVTYDQDTYTANSGILEYDSPKFSSVVDRESYRIVATDFIDEFREEIENNVVGRDIEVRVGFFDSNDDPVLTVSDVLLVYKGQVDSPSIVNDFDTKIVTFEGTSPMSDLDIINSFIASKDGMAQKSSSDTSFDKIYGDAVIRLRWGKI